MLRQYQEAIIREQFQALLRRAETESWTDFSAEREECLIFVALRAPTADNYEYLVRIDMSGYPVDPYWIGFVNPNLRKHQRAGASDSDARFWPWSPMPGLHGSFILAFQGPYRTFWCRECNFPFFYYHGDRRWAPGAWPLERVVSYLRDAIAHAESPARWRPLQLETLRPAATAARVNIPDDTGIGDVW